MIEKELQSWKSYNAKLPMNYPEDREKVNVACPECGKQLWRRNDIVLTSYPAQYKYECECGWTGYAFC